MDGSRGDGEEESGIRLIRTHCHVQSMRTVYAHQMSTWINVHLVGAGRGVGAWWEWMVTLHVGGDDGG